MPSYIEIFENNKEWVKGKLQSHPDFFKELSKGQQPDFLYIGCSDSRVQPAQLMGMDAGDVFVHRNIANVIDSTDNNVMSVVQYAVEHLKVKHIIVCGHYGCGGVEAAMQSNDLGQLNPWLSKIRDVYRIHKKELDAISDINYRFKRLVEHNVEEQCINLLKTSVVQKAYLNTGFPSIYGCVFDLETGLIKDLNLNLHDILRNLQHIYDLGTEVIED